MVFCSDGICIYITLFMQQCVDVKDFNVWIVPSDETSTLQIRYYLYDRSDDLGLSDVPFRYFVMDDVIASSVTEGLYRFSNGKLANLLLME